MTSTIDFDTTRGPIPLHPGERRFIAPPDGVHASAFDLAGTDVRGTTSVEAALVQAGLDWTVSKRPVFIANGQDFVQVPGRAAIARDDTDAVLGVMSTSYEPVQSLDALIMLDNLIDSDGLEIVSAGEYRGGRIVWMQARLPSSTISRVDPHVPYLLFANGHDGSYALRFIAGTLRLFCGNALPRARRLATGGDGGRESGGAVWSASHLPNVNQRIEEAREALGLAVAEAHDWDAAAAKMMGARLTLPTVDVFLASLFPADDDTPAAIRTRAENRRAEVRALYSDESRLGAATGNWWGMVQAVNTWATWERPGTRTNPASTRNLGLVLRGTTDSYTKQTLVIARQSAGLN